MEIYLVGGAVRDQLLGYPFHERDWVVVGATADQLLAMGYSPVGKDFPVFLHPKTKEEYALARTERKTGPGYTGFHCFSHPSVSLEEDLQRRDLTINAMAQTEDGSIVDPYGGQKDLQHRQLRHVSPAFIEDPLRVIRTARFLARYHHLGFSIASETLALMQEITENGELQTLPKERLWRECERALGERSSDQFFIALKQCQAMATLFPELLSLPDKTLTLLACDTAIKLSTQQRFALLFFDVPIEETQRLLTRLAPPKDYQALAILVSEFGNRCCQTLLSSEDLLSLLEKTDTFRRHERFLQLLESCQVIAPHSPTPNQLQKAFNACKTIQAATFVAQGLKGPEIASAIRKARLNAIQQMEKP